VTGRLDEILFVDGQEVKEGDVLLRLDAADLAAELENAKATLKRAQQDYDRAVPLRGSQAVSQARLDELFALRDAAEASVAAHAARLGEFTIKAPFDGTVGVNRLSRGAVIRPETPITTIDDLRIIKVDFAVTETVIQKITEGDRIVATSRALDGAKIEGKIQSIETRIDPVNRTIGAVAVFDNEKRLLRPGMFLSLRISLDERSGAVFVAEEALAPSGGKQFVFVIDNNVVERREVVVGLREPGLVEIKQGIKVGEVVVVRGTQFMRDGAEVVIQERIEPGQAPSYRQS
jgi:membrane fusion protein (multidrug efflux system)